MTQERASKTHYLKTWPVAFQDLVDGKKNFEYRKNDRGFQVGDTLILKEWNPAEYGCFTGRVEKRTVSYILQGGQFGIPDGFCIMELAHPLPELTLIGDTATAEKELEKAKLPTLFSYREAFFTGCKAQFEADKKALKGIQEK